MGQHDRLCAPVAAGGEQFERAAPISLEMPRLVSPSLALLGLKEAFYP
jgi:hypothetical protein